jgi:hypothetical protein
MVESLKALRSLWPEQNCNSLKMVLKVLIISVLFLISGILGRPQQQSDKPLCSEYDGYRLVYY